MCKEKNLSVKGTKYDMAMRILDIHEKKPIIDSSTIILRIKKNQYGNYTHEESSMVFDQNTKRVIGVQLENGNIRTLNRNDIETCQKYKFQYDLPVSLDPSPIFEILENSDDDHGESESYLDEEEDNDDISDHDEDN